MVGNYFFQLDKSDFFIYNSVELNRTVARYYAERYYREESPCFTGQDN